MLYPPASRCRASVSRLASLFLAILVSAASTGIAQAQSTEVVASEPLSKLGVPSYRVEVAGSTATVELLTFEKRNGGTVHLSWGIEEGTRVELERAGVHLLLTFQPVQKRVHLANLHTDESASGAFGADGWMMDEQARAFFDLYAGEVALMSEVNDEVLAKHVRGERRQEQQACTAPAASVPGDLPQATDKGTCITCNGLWVRGTNWASLSKSACCQEAKEDANLKCWNRYCIGCCEFLECDALCAAGDYLCAPCGIYGHSCSGFTCEKPPPPGCATNVGEVSVLEVGGGGAYQLVSAPFTLRRLESSEVMHGGKQVSYLMEEWAVLAVEPTGTALKSASAVRSLRSSSEEFAQTQVDRLDVSKVTGRRKAQTAQAGERIALVVAMPPHEANSRQIEMPKLRVASEGVPGGSGRGFVVVRVDFGESGQLQDFEILHDTLGGVPPELALHIEKALSLERFSEKEHRAVAFAVLAVGETLKVESDLVTLLKCCCGDFFCE